MKTATLALACALAALCAPPAGGQQRAAATHTYVIVHGAWGGGWDWRPVDSLLTAAGHRVHRVTLTGLGERVHLATPSTDLTTHVTDVVNAIRFEELHDVVLVGHSYGGMVITGVAERIPDRIRHLVYVDAFLPENGESVVTASNGRPIQRLVRMMLDSARNDLMVPPWVRPDTPPPVDTPQPLKTFTETLTLESPAARRIPGTYILTVAPGRAEADDDFAPFSQRAKARGFAHHVLRADHTPERSARRELVALLHAVP